jgi:hypothetical protein
MLEMVPFASLRVTIRGQGDNPRDEIELRSA